MKLLKIPNHINQKNTKPKKNPRKKNFTWSSSRCTCCCCSVSHLLPSWCTWCNTDLLCCFSGFLRSDTLVGTANVKLQPLETACEIHDSFDVSVNHLISLRLQNIYNIFIIKIFFFNSIKI